MKNIRVRYGPSPTGIPHIGNLRTALYNFLFAKSQNGAFILRIEDTDQNRIVEGAVDKIKESLELLNLKWDEEYIQSTRLPIYQQYLEQLKKNNLVKQEKGAWRFKVDRSLKEISWEDLVHGTISFPTNVLEDFIIIKSDGFPTYHFASVVDDHEMKISHVFRGDEWISSTPKHLNLYSAFGWKPPEFAHLPAILGPDHKKLSKRSGAKSAIEYVDEGYLPQAIVNCLALLGWSPKGNQEVFSLEELSKEFSIARINKNSPIFSIEKLNWFNGQWIRRLGDRDMAKMIKKQYPAFDKQLILKLVPLVKDRLSKISDFKDITGFFLEKPNLKSHGSQIAVNQEVFQKLIAHLNKIKNWKEAELLDTASRLMEIEKLSKAQLYRSIGIAISGRLVTPPIFASMEILGKDETIERLKSAAEKTTKK